MGFANIYRTWLCKRALPGLAAQLGFTKALRCCGEALPHKVISTSARLSIEGRAASASSSQPCEAAVCHQWLGAPGNRHGWGNSHEG